MTKLAQSPGDVLQFFIRAYELNPTSLAKQLKLSQATVRLLTLDKTKISVHIALRLAKFFDMQPDYWLKLQNDYDLDVAAKNTKIKAVLQSIPKAVKPSAPQDTAATKAVARKTATGKKPKAKTAGKRGPKPKTVAGKGAPRGRPAKKQKAGF